MPDFIRRATDDAGFDLAGIAPVRQYPELDYFPAWIASGHAGEMRYLETRGESGNLKRASLAEVAPWARSVIVCAINYNTAQSWSTADRRPSTGWISRYAWSAQDYHASVLRRLHAVEAKLKQESPDCETRCYVDTGPLVERVWAKYAGIGWQGKNTCLINQQIGSWIFLGVILTSIELQPDLPVPDRCGACTRCLDACPTNAFVAPYQLDATRCISYLTIEKRGDIPEDLRDGIGRHVFGCDICQEVCPWNRRAPVTAAPEFAPRPGLVNPALEWLAAMNEDEFRAALRGSPIKRARYNGLRRNVAIAMGNSGDSRFLPTLQKLAAGPDPAVASHARWAIDKLHQRG
ncbi:MAG: tRNA epoxyqueuosine(34) reductase QueG [Acidobacteriia bacterium]|nr:tRNA epoxyqueuosine(34) reductase QueG [Terriglobia bacterium]